MEFRQSNKLRDVCYEIRGPVVEQANLLEEAGHSVLRLNTGNPALFDFEAPEEIVQDMIRMLPHAHGYTDSRGVLPARRAVAGRYQARGLDVDVDDVFLGNGVSELISMAVQALVEDGDEVLVPAPDYPLWTAVATLAGGHAVHYRCDVVEVGEPVGRLVAAVVHGASAGERGDCGPERVVRRRDEHLVAVLDQRLHGHRDQLGDTCLLYTSDAADEL